MYDLTLVALLGSPVASVVAGSVSVVVLVLAVLLCTACKKQPKPEQEYHFDHAHIENGAVPTKEGIASEVQLRAPNGHANGSVTWDDSRPKSHEQRALPPPPVVPVIQEDSQVSQTDDELQDDGHYDIIPRLASSTPRHPPSTPSKSLSTPTHGQNLYEVVKGEKDSVATGVSDDTASSASFPQNPSHPYTMVDRVGSPTYAKVSSKHDRVSALGADSQTVSSSVDTLNSDNYASVPPVPIKRFSASEEALDATSAKANVSPSLQHPSPSPELPPRNDTQNSFLPPDGMIVGADGGAGVSLVSSSGDLNGAANGNGKREPPYSQLTAREKLENLRQREGHGTASDATYESVNYDQVKVPPAAAGAQSSNSLAGDNVSDLYAEINTAGSTRSSTYAQVGDVQQGGASAPAPPSVDSLLRKLPKSSQYAEDDGSDPGYSRIDQARPHSIASTSSQRVSCYANPVAMREPVYAMVNKPRRNRRTVHVDENVASSLRHEVSSAREPQDVYAVVNKPGRPQASQNGPSTSTAASYLNQGARPKKKKVPTATLR